LIVVKADRVFSMLMGDEVPQERIERNAVYANIDA
jgi:hypothetical protein